VAGISFPQIPEEKALKRMKVNDLREWCGACAVGVSGTKDILIGRLNTVRVEPAPAKAHVQGSAQRAPNHVSPQKKTPSKAQSHADQKKKQVKDLCEKYCTTDGHIEMDGFLRFGLDLAGGSEEKSVTPQHTFFLFVRPASHSLCCANNALLNARHLLQRFVAHRVLRHPDPHLPPAP
jgi:hypothetical protein